MEKLIPLAQVEQLIDEMMNQRENALHSIGNDKYLQDSRTRINGEKKTLERLKSKLSSLPTEESGWIAMETPPTDDEEYNIVTTDGLVTCLPWSTDEKSFMIGPNWQRADTEKITHWQFLPKPPLQ